LSTSFDSVFAKTNKLLNDNNDNLGTRRRNNDLFTKLAAKYESQTEINKGLRAMVLLNNILQV